MMNRLKNGSKFFFNVETMEGSWTKDDQIEKDFSLLTRDDIEVSSAVFKVFFTII